LVLRDDVIRCGVDEERTIVFLWGCSPSAGDAIKAAAAKQLMKTKHLVFIFLLLSLESVSQMR